MNVNVEQLSSIKRKLTIELPAEDAANLREKHLREMTKKAALKGFRPGKAPKSLVAKLYGDHIKSLVMEELISENMSKIIEDHKLEPLGTPIIESASLDENEPLKFVVVMEVRPEFTTPNWEGLELTREKYEITDEIIGKNLDDLRLRLATIKNVDEDRPLADGDMAVISYQAFDGETLVSELKNDRATVELGRDQLLPEFEKNLPGLKRNETREFPVTLPKEAGEKKLAGRTVTMKVTLLEIKQRELPPLDDELAKDLGLDGVETLAALKDKLRQDLINANEARLDRALDQQLTEKLAALVDLEVPQALMDREMELMIEAARANFRRNGMDMDKFGLDPAVMKENFKPKAETKVRAALVLNQIANDLQVETTEDDVDAELEKMSKEYSQPVQVLREFHEANDLVKTLKQSLRASKTMTAVKGKAKITEVEPTPESQDGQTKQDGEE